MGRLRPLGFITQPAAVRQVPEHIGEPSTAPAIAAASLAAAGKEFEAIPDRRFYQILVW